MSATYPWQVFGHLVPPRHDNKRELRSIHSNADRAFHAARRLAIYIHDSQKEAILDVRRRREDVDAEAHPGIRRHDRPRYVFKVDESCVKVVYYDDQGNVRKKRYLR